MIGVAAVAVESSNSDSDSLLGGIGTCRETL